MFNRLIDDAKLATGAAARQVFLVAAVALSLFVTTGFLCAAAFVFVLERYGLVQACLSGAAIFFIVTAISAASYFSLKKPPAKPSPEEPKASAPSFMPDPMMLMTGLQVARAIGLKRLVPIIAIGGLALGIMAARSQSGDSEAPPDQ